MTKTELLEHMVEIYVANCNLHKNVKLSKFQKHIQGKDESDLVLERQIKLNRLIIKVIDELSKHPSKLCDRISPFDIDKNDILRKINN